MDWLRRVINHPLTERFIAALIILNAVTLGLETSASAMVNAMQAEHAKAEERELKVERDMMHEETMPLVREIKELKSEIASLREQLVRRGRRS